MATHNGLLVNNAPLPVLEIAFQVPETRNEKYAKITVMVLAILFTLALVIMIGVDIGLKYS